MSDAIGGIAPVMPQPAETWISKIEDQEVRGHLQNKAWDKLDPISAVEQAVKAHRGAERMLGAPADSLLRIPKDDDEAGWKQFYRRLGSPENMDQYDLSPYKFDNDDQTNNFQNIVKQTAAELNIPKSMAERLAQSFHKFVTDTNSAKQTEQSALLQAEKEKLIAEWGRPDDHVYRANMMVADETAAKLGITQEAMAKLKDGIGAAEVAKLMNKIGRMTGEDKYVAGQNPMPSGVMSREQAAARKSELMADKQWVDRYLKKGSAEMREMKSLLQIMVDQ